MKRMLLAAALLLSLTMNACQCAEPPPVGPVEGQESAAAARP